MSLKSKIGLSVVKRFVKNLDPDDLEEVLLFCLGVAKIIIDITPSKADDVVFNTVAPALEKIADMIGDIDGDE